ncbi:MAG TPA: SDR family NAD(P)-dependent oxidoreductase [Candidatus Methylomirabilis sp.]|nr:SDR family NAD(P)-dependent oxidoreductase [Candidatus Methylomirabilis sp.]
MTHGTALIVGAGKGLSASLARRLAAEGFHVALMARNVDKLTALVRETSARTYPGDARDPAAIETIFERVERELGPLELVVFNAGERYRGPIEELAPEKVLDAYRTTAFAGFLAAQAAAKRMLKQGRGSIFFTGATASVKALPQSVPFSMAKFALRALAQSLARELAPKNIHVVHFVLDGGLASSWAKPTETGPADRWLDPDAVAQAYLDAHRQHRSAWSWEIELRPWVETF